MLKPILLDLPEMIRTPRLILRPMKPGEGVHLNEAILESFNELKKWMPWAQDIPTPEDSEENVRLAFAQWIMRTDLRISFFDRQSGKFLGSSGLHDLDWNARSFSIGFWCRTSAQGQGYVTEAANALTRFAFQFLDARRVSITCDSDNERSKKVIERLGFELEGRLRNHAISIDGRKMRDTLVFSRVGVQNLPPLDVAWT